ncbi:uroporphyrinogen decarboxylase family protein [Candidatus Bathyarchaeota archaeon]|nr:uroporphyrinogen decarboxylase family protein [Candidatus Bathyarchaeota archaeon]
MNHRERFYTALELKEPDLVPVTDLGLDQPIVEAVLKKTPGQKVGETMLGLMGGGEWESSINFRLAMVEACIRLGFDAAPVFSDYSLAKKSFKPRFIDGKRFIDQWGRIMQTSIEGKTTYFVGGTVNTPEDLENYEPPDGYDPEIMEIMNKIMKPLKGQDIVTMGQCHSGWHMVFQARGGIDKLSVDFYKNPSFARKFFDKMSRACTRIAEAMVEAGVDILFVTDDYADNHGPLISPKIFREYELPCLKRIVDVGRKHGVPVLKHSDGNLYPILDDIVRTGISGLHPIEPGAMDLKDVKERYGDRICLLGNVDCRYVLPYGSEEDVRRDVRRCIDAAGEGGGFILASSNSLHSNVKVENIYVMVDEARRYGKYPIKSGQTIQ